MCIWPVVNTCDDLVDDQHIFLFTSTEQLIIKKYGKYQWSYEAALAAFVISILHYLHLVSRPSVRSWQKWARVRNLWYFSRFFIDPVQNYNIFLTSIDLLHKISRYIHWIKLVIWYTHIKVLWHWVKNSYNMYLSALSESV